MPSERREPNPLWIERYADATRLAGLADRLVGTDPTAVDPDEPSETDRPPYGAYLVVTAAWLVTTAGFGAVQFARDGTVPVLRTPGLLLGLAPWLLVVYVIFRLRDRYASVVDGLPDPVSLEHAREPRRTRRFLRAVGWDDPAGGVAKAEIVPRRTKLGLLVLGLGLHASWFVLDPSPMSHLTAVYGRALASVYFLVLVPLVYVVIGVELVSLYVGVLVLLPLKVTATDRIDFTDAKRFGGLRPLGRLLRDATASLLVFLALFAVFETIAVGSDPLDPFSRVVLFGGMAFAAAAFLGPVYWLHKFMRHQKEARIDDITDEIRHSGPDDDVFPDTRPVEPSHYDEYTYEYIKLSRVENMREFPVDFSLVLEFVFVLILPYLAHVSSIFVFEELLH